MINIFKFLNRQKETARITERNPFTVMYIDKSKSFKNYRQIIKEYGIRRAKNLVARLEGGE